MNRHTRWITLMLAISAAGCALTEPDDAASITHGTSFGMCVGYCTSILAIEGNTVTLTETSRDSGAYPRKTRTLELTATERARLDTLSSADGVARVAGVHGCPDCADGGAEWVALNTAGRTIEARYEYGHDLPAIAELQAELRALRRRFP